MSGGVSKLEHFFAKVYKHHGGCWLWTGSRSQGYGKFHSQGRAHTAHRFIYEATVGPIPDGLVLDHLCNLRICVNPAHLEVVTIADNTRRSPRSSRSYAWLDEKATA